MKGPMVKLIGPLQPLMMEKLPLIIPLPQWKQRDLLSATSLLICEKSG